MRDQFQTYSATAKAVSFNEGLRSYMLGIYNHMTAALALSGVVAYFAARTGIAAAIFTSPLGIVVALAPIGISLYMGFKLQSMPVARARGLLFIYAAMMGLSLSTIFLVFSAQEIGRAFFITASMFAGMSIYGYTTKSDLSSIGSMLIMGVWGILIASLVNMFMRSDALSFTVSFMAVIIFTVLTAYDTNKLKQSYYSVSHNPELAAKVSVFGALQLYLDFVAIFIHLLNLMRNFRDGR